MSGERIHMLKTWPEPFEAVRSGRKRYEIRVDDRGFAVGDVLHLREYEPGPGGEGSVGAHYTGRELWAKVTYLTPSGAWGLPQGICVMSINVVSCYPK